MQGSLPLLLGAGAVAIFAFGRKKKPKQDSYTDLPPPDEDDENVVPGLDTPPVIARPARPKRTPPPNPAGPGPYGNYDHDYWEKGSWQENNKNIRRHFGDLGYISGNRSGETVSMNVLGPLGVGPDMPGNDGQIGKLGGGDDKPSTEVRKFQNEYNRVSKSKTLIPGMGELIADGFVGPETLNALKIAKDNINGKRWPDVVKQAGIAGY